MTADLPLTDRYECLAALYTKRYGNADNKYQWGEWHRHQALEDAVDRIIELERELAAARAALEGDPR